MVVQADEEELFLSGVGDRMLELEHMHVWRGLRVFYPFNQLFSAQLCGLYASHSADLFQPC